MGQEFAGRCFFCRLGLKGVSASLIRFAWKRRFKEQIGGGLHGRSFVFLHLVSVEKILDDGAMSLLLSRRV